ncbi:transcriptional regulator, TetR family [Streptomyces sp. DvalAA-14]|uniref:TetR/AcrR family transcriptional regulator n=1 Tax=unclassified Streptomyces TaxID=2593676 RepID=UPI00081B6FE2|nr:MULTISPECIES: TetR/AcrR family transcriptional regulator [unclassified Streptomyces]MYS23928.1 TetR family transcriptional regulator [Streptomyces sp. SID4948]SCE40610.1 transcriptional regulator, TetR family [Streptomyces sp. DvalAA-14]
MSPEAAAGRRTRLTPERERELYEAVVGLLREVGYEALTMDAVAARTRASKATLYRQWKGKPELVATALRHHKPVSLADIDTGSLPGDLHELVRCHDQSEVKRDQELMRGLAHAAFQNEDLFRALRELLIEPELASFRDLVQRAVDRGELAADSPARDFVPHMLFGGALARPIIEGIDPDPEYSHRFIDAVVVPALGLS